jgi:hypothetical protein
MTIDIVVNVDELKQEIVFGSKDGEDSTFEAERRSETTRIPINLHAKYQTGQSIHSRAARRATSPGINTDKSLKEVEPPADYKPKILAVQSSGITKKKNGRKSVLSAKARKRHEKGMDRAEAVMDKKEKLIEKSRARARNVQDRAKNWDELNKKILMAEENATEKAGKKDKGEEDWEDEPRVEMTAEGDGLVSTEGDSKVPEKGVDEEL